MTVDFDALYRSHYRRVFGLCLKLLGGRNEAEDAAQEVFLRAYRAIDNYDASQPFAAWVLSIASHHCIDRLRRSSREPAPFDDPESAIEALEADWPAASEIIGADQRDERVRAAIADLPDKYRVPLVLAYFHGSSYGEIAAALGITRNHVGVLLLRAKQALRHALADTAAEIFQ